MSKDLQIISKEFIVSRTTKSFNAFYKAFRPLAMQLSMQILKDYDYAEENVSKVFMKIFRNTDFVFDDTKSYASYFYSTVQHSAIMIYNKNKKSKFISESKFNFDDEFEGSILDYLNVQNNGEEVLAEIDVEESEFLHNSKSKKCEHLKKIIKETGENAELLMDFLINGFEQEEIREKYNLNTVGAVKSRVCRARKEIKERFENDLSASKMMDGIITDGTIKTYNKNSVSSIITIKDKKREGEFIKYFSKDKIKQKSNYKNGKLDGQYQEFYENGVLRKTGTYDNGKKIGFWTYFDENGKIDEVNAYASDGSRCYELYDESGNVELTGTIKMATN